MQQRASKIHFDVLVKTPIIVFPRLVVTDSPNRDSLTVNLGEIYANNKFTPLADDGSDVSNKISAGIRNTGLRSLFHYDDDRSEELEMINKIDLGFEITSVDHKKGYERPDTEIVGNISDINLKVSQDQLKFILELARTIPAAFATEPEEEVEQELEEELPEETTKPAKAVSNGAESKAVEQKKQDEKPTNLGPELGTGEDTWTKLDLVFKAPTIGLELIQAQNNEPVGDLESASLSKFSLNQTHVKLRMISDGGIESELLIQSFTIKDSRTKETNKFRKIMSLINNDVKQQFMASVSISGGSEKRLVAILTVDSPRVILALDYLFAIQAFATASLAADEPLEVDEGGEENDHHDDDASVATEHSGMLTRPGTEATSVEDASTQDKGMDISFRVNLVDAQ
ncbi:hypothetical protein LTS18_014563, partial [Coniosporium uncinatum]